MPVRSLSFCNLVAIWLETLLYGVYVVFLIPTVNVLLFRPLSTRYASGSGPRLNQAYLAGIFALWTFSTIHVAAGLGMLLEAFVLFPDISSESYFSRTTSQLNTLRTVAFLASITVADLIMIRHVYVLWYRSMVIAFIPLFNLGLIIISGIIVFTFSSQLPPTPPLLPSSSISVDFFGLLTPTLRILVPFHVAMSFITNSWISIFAAIRLWREGSFMEEVGGWSYRRQIIVAVGETGLLFPLTALVALLLSIAGTNGQIIPFTALAPLAAILPTLMILTVELGYTPCPPNSPFRRYPRSRSDSLMGSSLVSTEKAPTSPMPAMAPPTRSISTPPEVCQSSSAQVAYFRPGDKFVFKTEPGTPLPVGSAALRNTRLPPIPSTPPPVPSARHRAKHAPVPPLRLIPKSARPDSLPLAPHTPTPRIQMPSPFETHFPRTGRIERVSQQTFNPRRENAGNGGTAYTTFGNSSFARMLVMAKEGGDNKLPPTLAPEIPGSPNVGKVKEKERKGKGKKLMLLNSDLLQGVYMTKAVEKKIDYIEKEMS